MKNSAYLAFLQIHFWILIRKRLVKKFSIWILSSQLRGSQIGFIDIRKCWKKITWKLEFLICKSEHSTDFLRLVQVMEK